MNESNTARTWVIHWPTIDPTVKRYQHPVTLERVLDDHRAALAAVPMNEVQCSQATAADSMFFGSLLGDPITGNRDPDVSLATGF